MRVEVWRSALSHKLLLSSEDRQPLPTEADGAAGVVALHLCS